MKKLSFLAYCVWNNWQVLYFVYDMEGRELFFPDFCTESEKVITPSLLDVLYKSAVSAQCPIFYYEPGRNLYYWAFLSEKEIHILGPMCSDSLSFAVEREFLHQRKIRRKDFPFREMDLSRSMHMISFVYYVVTGNMLEGDTWIFTELNYEKLNSERIKSLMLSDKGDRARLSYQYEREWYQSVKTGKYTSRHQNAEILDRVGVMAVRDAHKQMEYTIVTAIVLASRAAIEGGVVPFEAYSMSDLFLQKCSECTQLSEMLQIGEQSMNYFSDMVRQKRDSYRRDNDVEHCKDYIAQHLTKKISVKEMAAELRISYSYLAAKFQKDTGMNIKQYILKEKLWAAANQLKYSEASVGEIAQYLAFPSSSSMGSYFKEMYGMTPLQYRTMNRVEKI